MKLYHGTNAKYLDSILANGIRPRGAKGKSNWKHTVPSNPKTVYLTNAYALYYALCAAKAGGDLVLFEVVPALCPTPRWVPDEDAVEQALRGKDGIDGTMKERTLHYRRMALKFAGSIDHPHIQDSLKALGNCGYMGVVPPTAITRYAVVSQDKVAKQFLWAAIDPTITLMNYQICGAKYRNMVRWVFGDELEPERGIPGFDFTPPESRAGITLHEVKDGQV